MASYWVFFLLGLGSTSDVKSEFLGHSSFAFLFDYVSV